MESKLKCPFCQQELREIYFNGVGVGYICPNPRCKKAEKLKGNTEFWQALIQAKQDSEVTQKALDIANEKLRHCVNITVEELDELKGNLLIAHNALLYFSKDPIAIKALEQIEHKGA